MKKKKNMIIGGLLAVVFLMSVGYAAFASNLSITGTANTSSWIIKITNIREKTKTAGVTNKGTSYTDLTANFNCELTLPGDSITYEVTVENQGNIDASLKEVTKSFTNNKYIDVTYSGLVKGQMLYKQGAENSTAVMEVIVTFKDLDYEGTFTDTITSNISLNLDFEQEGNNVDTTKKYLVEYDSQGGEPVANRYVKWDDTCLSCVETTKNGYSFGGWHLRPGGSGMHVYGGTHTSDIIDDENQESLTLYAYWLPKSYTILYDTQGGSAISNTSRGWEASYLINNTPTKQGYNFEGWYTAPNGQGMKITNSTTVQDIVKKVYGVGTDVAGGDNGTEVTIYANWVENEYTTIVFMPKDARRSPASNMPDNIEVKCTDTITIDKTPTREGYTFKGWNTSSDGNSGTTFVNGMSIKEAFEYCPVGTTYLYAMWE